MTANEDAVIAAEKLAIHQKLVNRIAARAVAEGKPLTSIQTRQFESDSMSKEEYWKFDEEFKRENEWQDFMDRISGLLRSAIAEDAANDPDAPARYDAMVHKLEDPPRASRCGPVACRQFLGTNPLITGQLSLAGWGSLR